MDGIAAHIYVWASWWAVRRTITERTRLRNRPNNGRFTQRDVSVILRRTWELFASFSYEESQADVSTQRVLLLARLTHALFQALIESGVERTYAIELTSDTIWKLYSRMQGLRHFLNTALTRPDQAKRMRISTRRAFQHLPSSYTWHSVPNEGGIAFEISRCPVAEYFQAHGMPDLCAGAWCNQDYGLAEIWGGQLQRDGTLVTGSDHCDFRFRDVPLDRVSHSISQ